MTIEADEKKPRLDTSLESEGAEFLVLGQLLIRRIPAAKAYTNQRDFDLVVFSPQTNKFATIQVKSRLGKDAWQFNVGKIKSDFLVLVGLNRQGVGGTGSTDEPDYYILPVRDALPLVRDADRKVPYIVWDRQQLNRYRNQWEPIRLFLARPPKRTERKSK
jgi:hypothetical protein